MKNKILFLIIIPILFINVISAVLISDQGTDVKEVATGNLTALANLTISIYDAMTGGNLIFEQTFTNGIANGSWNVMINPDLEYGESYWKDYQINGEDLDFDGNERLEFQSSLGLINNISFINFSLISSCPEGSSIRLIYENGSVLCETDDSGAGSYSDLWINNTIDSKINTNNESINNYISSNNNSIINWITSAFAQISNLLNLVGNWSADKANYYNTTQIQEINISMKNYVDYVNSTNGAGIGTDTFIANYSTFLTHIDWITAMNGTLFQASQWNATNTSYMTGDNFTLQNNSINNYILYVNSTNGAGSGDYDDSWINQTIYNKSVVDYNLTNVNASMKNYVDWVNSTNPGGISVESDPYWQANYSTFIVNNQSLTNYLESNNLSIENYILYVNSTNGEGSISYSDSWINSTIDSKILIQNNSVVNWVNNVFVSISTLVDRVGNWSADKVDYYTSSQVNDINTSVTNTFSLYANLDVLNNGSYLNPASNDSFIANYSTFLTHITWATAMNGTLAKSSELNNGSYFNNFNIADYSLLTTLNNGSYLNQDLSTYTTLNILNNGTYLNTDTFIANYSQFLVNNQSLTNYILYVNSTNGDGSVDLSSYLLISNWNATNSSYLTSGDLSPYLLITNWNATNSSYAETSYVNLQNTSLNNYINSLSIPDNDTINNYIAENNQSVNNWVTSTFATISSLSDYVLSANIINLVGNWSADKSSYYTSLEVDDINTSMKNYVDYVNTTSSFSESDPYWAANWTDVAFTNIHEAFDENVTFEGNITQSANSFCWDSWIDGNGTKWEMRRAC